MKDFVRAADVSWTTVLLTALAGISGGVGSQLEPEPKPNNTPFCGSGLLRTLSPNPKPQTPTLLALNPKFWQVMDGHRLYTPWTDFHVGLKVDTMRGDRFKDSAQVLDLRVQGL